MKSRKNKPNLPQSTEEEVFVYVLLTRFGCTGEEATALWNIIKNMASSTVIDRIDAGYTRLESKIDAQNSLIDAQNSLITAQNSKYNLLIGLISFGLALVIATIGWLLAGGVS